MATNQTTPVAVAPPQHKEVEHFSDAERAAWLKDGTMPLVEQDPPVKKDETQASSIPVKKAEGQGSAKQERSAVERTAEEKEAEKELNFKALRERTDRLEAELEEYRTGKKKVEEKKADATAPKLLELPARPKMKDFMNEAGELKNDEYEVALDKYETDKSAYINQQTQIRTAAAQQEQSIKTWTTDLKAKYGEKSDGVDVKKTVDRLAGTLRDAPAFFMFLNDSEVFTDLLFVLGTDPKLDELLAEAKDPKTMTRAIRKLVALEAGVKSELAKQAKDVADKNAKSDAEKAKLTRAGKPPAEAAGGDSAPADDGTPDAAWRRKDLSPAERGELYRERQNKLEREKRRKKAN